MRRLDPESCTKFGSYILRRVRCGSQMYQRPNRAGWLMLVDEQIIDTGYCLDRYIAGEQDANSSKS